MRRLVLALAMLLTAPMAMSAPQAAMEEASELVVGTKEAPPFAIKNEKGEWSGISIELWRKLAGDLKLQYRLVEAPSVTALLEGVEAGRFDVAVAAITVTPANRY